LDGGATWRSRWPLAMGGRFAGRFRAAGAAEVRGGGDAVEAV